MERAGMEWGTLRSLVFHMLEARRSIIPEDCVTEESGSPAYTLLLVAEGDCSLYAGDTLITALERSCYMMPPGQRWYVSNYSGRPVLLYVIAFKIMNAHTERVCLDPLRPSRDQWRLFPYARAVKLAEQLTSHEDGHPAEATGRDAERGMQGFNRQMLFLELVGMLLQHNSATSAASGTLSSAEQSVAFMEEHYRLPLSVKHLAEQAGVQPGPYTSMIRQLTGFAPLEYLNQIRIKHAKMLLLTGSDPLREIARRVGFEDEYYFSRRFRKMTGIAPRQYAEAMRGSKLVTDDAGHEVRIPRCPRRILYFGEALGDLLELGVRPVGSNLYELNASWLAEETNGLSGIEDIGIPFRLGQARKLEPDLIILSNMDERIYRDIVAIAPTLVYNSFDPLLQRLPRLGQWLDKEQEAERFIARYAWRLEQARELWRQRMRVGERVSVFICHRGHKWFMMGRLGLSELLHSVDEQALIEPIREMIAAGEAYRMIDRQDIARYAGDYIILPLPMNASSREATKQLLRSDLWRSLPAVRAGRALVVEESKWHLGDAISRIRQLEQWHTLIERLQE